MTSTTSNAPAPPLAPAGSALAHAARAFPTLFKVGLAELARLAANRSA